MLKSAFDHTISCIVCLLIPTVVICQFLRTPTNTEATVSSNVMLECRISNASRSVGWHHTPVGEVYPATVYFDEIIFDSYKGRFTVTGSQQRGEFNLIISIVNLEDAGIYTCTSGRFQHTAELIVFRQHPPRSCMVIAPSDGAIGQNGCGIEPDSIKLSCNISYRGNISPILEWKSLPSSSTNLNPSSATVNNVTISTLTVRADQTTNTQYNCSVRYPNSNLKSSFHWNAPILVNTLINQTKINHSDCQIGTIECTAGYKYSCNYSWILLNDSSWKSLPSASTLTVKGLFNGVYSCFAGCTIRQRHCTLVQQTFVQACTENELGETSNNVMVIAMCTSVAVLLLLTVVLVLYFFLRKHMPLYIERRSSGTAQNDAGMPLASNPNTDMS